MLVWCCSTDHADTGAAYGEPPTHSVEPRPRTASALWGEVGRLEKSKADCTVDQSFRQSGWKERGFQGCSSRSRAPRCRCCTQRSLTKDRTLQVKALALLEQSKKNQG
uniref:Uncharacterized protein n=1 Tax=Knipowitschia caucasica TaxID=637954 RepID=A0AAV2MJE5_KNICA